MLPSEPIVCGTGSETVVLNAVTSMDLAWDMSNVHYEFLNTEDTPSADDITSSLQNRKYDAMFKFYFLARPSIGRIQILALRLSINEASSSFQLRGEVVNQPLPTGVDDAFMYYQWYRDHFTFVRGTEHTEDGVYLGFYRLGISTLLELTDSKQYRFRSENTDLVFVKDLRRELIKTWPSIETNVLKKADFKQFDFESGRLFLWCRDGIHVIDYV